MTHRPFRFQNMRLNGCRVLGLWLSLASFACVSPGPHLSNPPPLHASRAAISSSQLPASPPLPAAEPITDRDPLRFVEIENAWLRVRDLGPQHGDALPVVLVHGYGSRLEIWQELQQHLATERRTIAYDQRGFGLSERPAGAYGPEQHARDLLAVLDALAIDRAIVVGHSYGGGVVMRAALRAPERIAGIGLVDAFLLDEQVPRSFRWAQIPVVGELLFGAFYTEVPGEKYLLAFHDRARFVSVAALEEQKELMSKPGSVYAALETVRGMDYRAVESEYRNVHAPMLILWGEADRVTPLSAGKRLAAHLDGAAFHVLAGSGHVPSWERPLGMLRLLRPFLGEIDAGPRPVLLPASTTHAPDGFPNHSVQTNGGAL